MKQKILVLLLFLSSLSVLGQNRFNRSFEEGDANTLLEVTPLSKDELRLYFRTGYSRFSYAAYYPENDSLGHIKFFKTNWGGHLFDKSRQTFEIAPDKILTTFQLCCSAGGRNGMGIDYVSLRDTSQLDTYWLPYMSLSYNPILSKDSVFIFRSLDSIYNLEYRQFSDNKSFILSYYNLSTGQLSELDTIDFPFNIESPGTSFYNSEKRQFEFLYDSLQFFFTRGETGFDSIKTNYGDFWKAGKLSDNYLYGQNLARHNYIINDSCWWAEDTLGYEWLQLCKDRFGEISIGESYKRWAHSHCRDCLPLGQRVQDSTVISYLMVKASQDTTYHLYREDNGVITQSVLIKDFPKTFTVNSIYSNLDGSFYLAGNIHKTLNIPLLLKVDSQGNFKLIDSAHPFNLNYEPSTNALKIFLEDESDFYKYQIIDITGRLVQKGRFHTAEQIDLGDWHGTMYYLQLWDSSDNYIGQEAFIKH